MSTNCQLTPTPKAVEELLNVTNSRKRQVTTKTEMQATEIRCSHFIFPNLTQQLAIIENQQPERTELNQTGSHLPPKSLNEAALPSKWIRHSEDLSGLPRFMSFRGRQYIPNIHKRPHP